MKTLHLTNAWHGTSGGVATFYRALLDTADVYHHELRLAVPADEDRIENVGRYGRIYYIRSPRAPVNREYRLMMPDRFLLRGGALSEILRREIPDLVEVCDKYTMHYLAGLLRRAAVPGARFRPAVVGGVRGFLRALRRALRSREAGTAGTVAETGFSIHARKLARLGTHARRENRVTRRALLAAIAGAACRTVAGAVAGGSTRAYRADAVITFLSLPIFTLRGVGGGYALHSVRGDESRRTHDVSFVAGSWPARTRGLNRVGYIHESVVEGSAGILEADYFGFMTSSKEESLSEGRAALERPQQGAAPFVAIEGRFAGGQFRSTTARFDAEAGSNWSEWRRLEPLARTACSGAATIVSSEPAGGAATFLFSLLRAIRDPRKRLTQTYTYSRDTFRLETEKAADLKRGSQLAEKRLTTKPEHVWRIAGKARNLRTGRESGFKLWTEEGSNIPLPLRIEYKPKGFLELVFETVIS